MAEWVRLCGAAEAPPSGQLREFETAAGPICVANVGGKLSALDNLCPHREGPLAQGWIEGNAVVCPWHSWNFDLTTGVAEFPQGERVRIFSIRQEAEELLIQLLPVQS